MDELVPDYERFKDTNIKGKRLFNIVTFNPSNAKPGEEIYINISNLGTNMCLVPNWLLLTAKFKCSNTKSRFLNNLGKLLVHCLEVSVDGKAVYDNTDESLYSVYKDLWLPRDQRTK